MTDYKAIADRLVERGIGERTQPNLPRSNQKYYYAPDTYPDEPNDDEGFCHDWRVAGAVLEEIRKKGMTIMLGPDGVEQLEQPSWSGYHWENNESLPLAIILAYLEAAEVLHTQNDKLNTQSGDDD